MSSSMLIHQVVSKNITRCPVSLTWLPDKFQINWPFHSGEVQNRFSRWWLWLPSWTSDQNNFSYFLISSSPDIFYQVSSQHALGLGDEAQNRFSRRWSWRPSWISDGKDFSYFLSTSHPDTSTVSSQLAQGCKRSSLLKQIVDAAWQVTHNGHWLITITHMALHPQLN